MQLRESSDSNLLTGDIASWRSVVILRPNFDPKAKPSPHVLGILIIGTPIKLLGKSSPLHLASNLGHPQLKKRFLKFPQIDTGVWEKPPVPLSSVPPPAPDPQI